MPRVKGTPKRDQAKKAVTYSVKARPHKHYSIENEYELNDVVKIAKLGDTISLTTPNQMGS